jgi:2-dehydropantoate 2-reductase
MEAEDRYPAEGEPSAHDVTNGRGNPKRPPHVRVAVLGPGGVGGFLAALLARAGAPVTCIAGESSAAAIRAGGIRLTSERFGSFSVHLDAESELSRPADVLFVAVKEVDLGAALARVPSSLLHDGVVVPLLNGIDHLQVLREHFDAAQVVASTFRVESVRTAVGEIHQISPFAVMELAPIGAMPSSLSEVCQLLRSAGVEVRVGDDENAILWGKLSFLAPLALLTSVHAAPAGIIRTSHRDQLLRVVEEIAAVARAEGVHIVAGDIVAMLDAVPETMQSSMQRDLAAGRRIEIEAIGGAIVRHAQIHAVEVPEVAGIVADLRVQAGAR